jgi:hypothetical protein
MKGQKKCYYPSKIWNTVQDLAFSNHFEDGYEYELLIYFAKRYIKDLAIYDA